MNTMRRTKNDNKHDSQLTNGTNVNRFQELESCKDDDTMTTATTLSTIDEAEEANTNKKYPSDSISVAHKQCEHAVAKFYDAPAF